MRNRFLTIHNRFFCKRKGFLIREETARHRSEIWEVEAPSAPRPTAVDPEIAEVCAPNRAQLGQPQPGW